MANTYTLINSTSLSSSAASVTFSAIPATYDDLVVHISARANNSALRALVKTTINSVTSGYSYTWVYGLSGSAGSATDSAAAYWDASDISANTATSDTFGTLELYFPKYTGSQNKLGSTFGASETNAANGVLVGAQALLVSSTAAISSLKFEPNGGSFLSGSTFWLYGIKNS